MKLDMRKIYIDSRFRTANSKSESDFNVELPRSFNVPDGVVAHIDDIVIPVSWKTIDERNNKCYVAFGGVGAGVRESNFAFVPGNYDGAAFATSLAAGLNTAIVGYSVVPVFSCVHDIKENTLKISFVDPRTPLIKAAAPFILEFYTDAFLAGRSKEPANSINTIIGNMEQDTLVKEDTPYLCYIDLFNTRNLYLTSSALCSYDTVSNFGLDTIIKKIPCTGGYNKMIFQSTGSTIDGLDVSKRTLRYLDFRLVDSSFRTVSLQGNHFSFSIVFEQKR
jgi:hypothetical protein